MKRLHSFLFFIFLFTGLLFAVTCKKEYSYEGGENAQYSFVGSPNACIELVVQGNFVVGVPTVDSVNTIQLHINVTSPGLLTVTTNVVDGIYFSTGKLNITDTASNAGILLSCHGTPDSVGTFTFHIPDTTGCSFQVTVTGLPVAGIMLSGAPTDCGNPVEQGTYTTGITLTSANVVTINIEAASKGIYSVSTNQVNGISFSGSGTITSTGAQQLVLQGTGTPGSPELTQLTVTAGASQCTFYVPVANAEPVATYVLQSGVQGSTDYCSPGSVQGTYTSITPLSSSNTLTVNAYVTVPGNYTISTTQINGMSFSATGTFAATGAQDVVLKGSGTPIASGAFTFFPQIVGPAPIGGSTCGLNVIVQ